MSNEKNQGQASAAGGGAPQTEPVHFVLPLSLPPPRGPRLWAMLAVLLLVAGAMVAGVVWHEPLKSGAERLYSAVIGTAETPAAKEGETEGQVQYYTCGMHPWVILPKPGDCPICHMKLVPLDPKKFMAEVSINPILTQNIGVRVTPVVTGPVKRIVRTVGSVDYYEPLVRDVTLKVPGWIEHLFINYVGQPVKKGEVLLEIYSPELYTAQEEYLVAYRKIAANKGAPGVLPEFAKMDEDLLASGRKRLENFDISQEQIRQLEKAGVASRTMTLRSPFEGLVVVKNVYEGMRVDAGAQLLRIADLSKVWIMVTLYEYQIPFVQVGQKAVMTLPYVPGQEFEGKVTYIYPYVNPELRQVKVRMEFENPGLVLKPGMFANVELRDVLARERTLVPRAAVIETGVRNLALVSLGGGRFEPRDVKVGVESEGGMVEILDGLKPGEMVVTSGEFLLDSEARLREALAKMVKGVSAIEQPAAAEVGGAAELTSLPEPAAKALVGIFDAYLKIVDALSRDSLAGVPAAGRQVAENSSALIATPIPDHPKFWDEHAEVAQVRGKALELVEEKDLAMARERFADLSTALLKLLQSTGVPPSYGKELHILHCPMYREGQGGTYWVQPPGEVRNPYFGAAMLGCFDTRKALPVTGVKPPAPPAAPPPPAPAPPAKPGVMPPMPGM